MSSIWGAYLEDFHAIKLIIEKNIEYDTFYLYNDTSKQPLYIEHMEIYSNERQIYLRYEYPIELNKDYYIYINKEYTYHLSLGKITRSSMFEETFYYDGPLGIEYYPERTIFRIWSPVAKEVILVLNNEKMALSYQNKGLWQITICKNLDKASYYYLIRINEQYEKCLDPYGIASSANNTYNYVVDLKKTIQLQKKYKEYCSKPIIYEISMRDLCGNLDNNESAYLKGVSTLEYIKNLGITHLQIMPVFCFGGVNELIKNNNDTHFKYNWGYNPVQYNIPSGWFSSNPDDPYIRIEEFKTFINKCQQLDLGIVLDVVYNHVYQYENFCLGILVPGYVYRTNKDGFLMNSSYCGNDLRTEAKMVRRFIIDNLCFLQTEYKIDGFRFDLMGLIDNDTMLMARRTLEQQNPNTILYGEGWYMMTTLQENQNANLSSAKLLYPIAFFNDYFRNEISGSLQGNPGFAHGKKLSANELLDLVCHGSMAIMPFKDFMQSINYIECHDNYTFYDKTILALKADDDYLIPYLKLGLGLVVVSRGISFSHAGEELCRSKKQEHNSYNLSDDYNHIPWENRYTKYDFSNYLKNIINVVSQITFNMKAKAYYKDDYYEIRYGSEYQLIINNNYEKKTIYFSPGTYLIFDGDIKSTKCEKLDINIPGIWILKK